jgi:hypothetical protein
MVIYEDVEFKSDTLTFYHRERKHCSPHSSDKLGNGLRSAIRTFDQEANNAVVQENKRNSSSRGYFFCEGSSRGYAKKKRNEVIPPTILYT